MLAQPLASRARTQPCTKSRATFEKDTSRKSRNTRALLVSPPTVRRRPAALRPTQIKDRRSTIMKLTQIALALSFALPAASVFAQTTTATTPTNATINQRKENQQDRIAQGVKS